jgi:hypothetical protein
MFCHVSMIGGDLAVVMCVVSAINNELECRVMPAMTAVAFNTIFGALLAKTWVRTCDRETECVWDAAF